MDDIPQKPVHERGITVAHLFIAFLLIGMMGFGGVLPMLRHELVERRRWLTPTEFVELLSVCQILPGPNVVNLAVIFGVQVAGIRGALAAFFGILSMPVVVVLALASLYAVFAEVEAVQSMLRAIAAAAAGLIVAMTVKIALPVLNRPVALGLAGIAFVAIAGLRVPLLWVLIAMVPISLLLAFRSRDGRV